MSRRVEHAAAPPRQAGQRHPGRRSRLRTVCKPRRAWRQLPSGPATHFHRHPEHRQDSCSQAWPADMPMTPAVAMFIAERQPFEINGDLYCVDRVMQSADGPQSDVLVLRGHEYMRCDERSVLRAMQVRDLEALIDQDRVDIPFGPGARQWNLDRGCCRGGRTMGSLGIDLGGDA